MKYLSFLTALLGLLLAGCEEDKQAFRLQGNVVDDYTKKAIPHRKIIIQALLKKNDQFVPVHSKEVFTDSNGDFDCSLKKIKFVNFYNFSMVGDSMYAFGNKRIALHQIKKRRNYLCLEQSKLADFSINLKRTDDKPYEDTLYVSWISNGMDGRLLYPYKVQNYRIKNYGYSADLPFRWIGGEVESVVTTKVYADKETIIRWVLIRNGKPQEITDTIYCKRDAPNYAYFNY